MPDIKSGSEIQAQGEAGSLRGVRDAARQIENAPAPESIDDLLERQAEKLAASLRKNKADAKAGRGAFEGVGNTPK